MTSESASDNGLRARAAARLSVMPRGTVVAVAIALGAAIAAAALLDALWLDVGTLAWRTAVLGVVGSALVLKLAARHLRAPTFGAANTVTLVRATLTIVLLALLDLRAAEWWVMGLATLAAMLDGIDGALARRRGEASAFGARFDMETDALLILVLAALVWQNGKAGVWILAAGLLRYAFVAASFLLPWLRGALPPSRRRQTVCVVQIVSLIGALVPVVTQPASAALALAGLVVLIWSFAVDVAYLARQARP
ncbi:MAG TPA: CDP-alcohol phosphatidyltransferase family protein [Gammaproteobacteria bacterium]|nr:CDP-alcohol phosphatidyltransferase family protein [Gammaproteobacteria bacterium]